MASIVTCRVQVVLLIRREFVGELTCRSDRLYRSVARGYQHVRTVRSLEPHATLTRATCVIKRIKGRTWFAMLKKVVSSIVINIISRHCVAVISWFAVFCFSLVCHSCFLPQYSIRLACRAGFHLGLMPLLPVLRACLAACIAWHHPLYVQYGPAAPSATRH